MFLGVVACVLLLGLTGMTLSTLAQRTWVPLVISGGGLAALGLGIWRMGPASCAGDTAGCGMGQGIVVFLAILCGVPLLAGGIAALGWRVVVGPQADRPARIKALMAAFAVSVIAIVFLMTM